jgi:hypothetical protein
MKTKRGKEVTKLWITRKTDKVNSIIKTQISLFFLTKKRPKLSESSRQITLKDLLENDKHADLKIHSFITIIIQ